MDHFQVLGEALMTINLCEWPFHTWLKSPTSGLCVEDLLVWQTRDVLAIVVALSASISP